MMKKDVNRKQYEPELKQNAVKLTEKIGVVSTAYQYCPSILLITFANSLALRFFVT